MINDYLIDKIQYIQENLPAEEYDEFLHLVMIAKDKKQLAETVILYKRMIDNRLGVL